MRGSYDITAFTVELPFGFLLICDFECFNACKFINSFVDDIFVPFGCLG